MLGVVYGSLVRRGCNPAAPGLSPSAKWIIKSIIYAIIYGVYVSDHKPNGV